MSVFPRLVSRGIQGRFVSSTFANLTVRAGVDHEPEKVALILGDGRQWKYGDLMKRVGQYVTAFSEDYGLQKGDRVLSRVDKSVDALCIYLASIRLGLIYIPVNPAYTQKETAHFIKDSEPRLFVTSQPESDSVFVGRVRHVIAESSLVRETASRLSSPFAEHVTDNDVACICYTSGTTGLPKGAMLTHGGLSAGGLALVKAFQFTSEDRQLHMLPFYHVHGMFISLNCSLFSHSTIIWREKFTVEDALKWLPKATVMMGVPTFYSRLLASPLFTSSALSSVRLFTSGSAPLSLAVWEEFRDRTGFPILERYGMTEAQVICSNPYEASARVAGSVGMPLDGTQVRLNSDNVLECKSSSLFAGYWRNEQKTKEEFTDDGFFITGDVGRIDENGYVYILGRSKDMVISGGLNVYPKEIEDVLDKMESVQESAVIGVPHRDFGEAVVAVVVPSKKVVDPIQFESSLIKEARAQLASYKAPKKVVLVNSLPRNSMAKVQKKELREEYANLFK